MSNTDPIKARSDIAGTPSIAKLRPDQDGLDFAGLRQTGIDLLQELCGKVWTDYNLHDPGITLLEQLCFGLTDLVYRSRFEAQDYLFGADGRLDGASHALLEPEQALPCAPLTPLDYRKIFTDALPEIRNVWVVPATDNALPGIVNIHLQLADDIENESEGAQALLAEAVNLYHSHRNLCEDLGEISIVGHIDYRLSAKIDIADGHAASEILANIYFACATSISPAIPQQAYTDLADEELDLLLDGPFTQHGHIDGETFRQWNGPNLSELTQIISRIKGVSYVVELTLIDDMGRSCMDAAGDPARKRVPRLIVPRQDDDLHVRLYKSGKTIGVPSSDMLDCYDRFVFAAENRRHSRAAHKPISPLPIGTPAQFGNYTSIQHHLPPVYGIGHYGLPASAPATRKAEARQLQAYLLLCEQLMIDFQQGLALLPRLFSTDESVKNSYFHRVLREADLPGVKHLYRHGTNAASSSLGRALSWVDDFEERRSRVLDFMLAMHGEEFEEHSVHDFMDGNRWSIKAKHLRAKIAYLRRAPHLNGRGMSAFDYRKAPGPDNVSALAEKWALLLELPVPYDSSPTEAVRTQGFRHLSDDAFIREAGLARYATLAQAETPVPLSRVPEQSEASILDKDLLCPALMNRGSDLNHYRIVAEGRLGSAAYWLFISLAEQGDYCRLSRHPSKRSAVIEANRLSRFFDSLADNTAAFLLVEHLLLRGTANPDDSDFCASRMSAVFPDWSPRYASAEHRKMIERTIKFHCPAHISVDVLWLDFETMSTFEHLHGEWLRLKRSLPSNHPAVDRVARVLALLIERNAPKPGDSVQWL